MMKRILFAGSFIFISAVCFAALRSSTAGTTQRVDFGQQNAPSTALTISVWANITTNSSNQFGTIFGKSFSTVSPYNSYVIGASSAADATAPFFGVGLNDNIYYETELDTTVTPNLNSSWHSYVGTWSQTNGLKFYLDGVIRKQKNTAVSTIKYAANNTVFFIDGSFLTSSECDVQEAALWSVELTPQEVASLASPVKGTPLNIRRSNLLIYVPADEGYLNQTAGSVRWWTATEPINGTAANGVTWVSQNYLSGQ